MTYVEIYQAQNDGHQEIIAKCQLAAETVVVEGQKDIKSDLIINGIYDYTDPTGRAKLYPKDGLKFLEQLKFNFKSGYFNASEVMESK